MNDKKDMSMCDYIKFVNGVIMYKDLRNKFY